MYERTQTTLNIFYRTLAWYQVNGATATVKAASGSVTAQESTYDAGTVYLKAEVSLSAAALDYTDVNGKCFVIVGGYLRQATAAGSTWGVATVTLAAYSNEACTTPATPQELRNLASSGYAFSVAVTTDAPVRLAEGEALDTNFNTTFADALGDDFEFVPTLNAAGVWSNNVKKYVYSLNGDGATDVAAGHTDGEAFTGSEYKTGGTIATAVTATK